MQYTFNNLAKVLNINTSKHSC